MQNWPWIDCENPSCLRRFWLLLTYSTHTPWSTRIPSSPISHGIVQLGSCFSWMSNEHWADSDRSTHRIYFYFACTTKSQNIILRNLHCIQNFQWVVHFESTINWFTNHVIIHIRSIWHWVFDHLILTHLRQIRKYIRPSKKDEFEVINP